MEDVIAELNHLGALLKSLFGEMFADVVHFRQPYDFPNVHVDVSTEPVDILPPNGLGHGAGDTLGVQATPVMPSQSPIHHNRADRWGDMRSREIETGFGLGASVGGTRPVTFFTPSTSQSRIHSVMSNRTD